MAPKDQKRANNAVRHEESGETNKGSSFPIVGVGASAGGLEAFTELLTHLPLDTGMGFVLVQHLDPEHESALTQLLARATKMPVREIRNNQRVERNRVYVIPPNTNLGIARGVLKLRPRPETRTPHRSIDFFFESLAEDQRERAIGVILSGTATDGTLGLMTIKAEGGITFAQDDSARYDSMPRSAVAAGCVDFILSPEGIAKELARIAKHPYVAGQPAGSLIPAEDDRADATAHADDESPLPSGGRGAPKTGAQGARAEAGPGRGERTGARGAENGFQKVLRLLRNHCGVDFSLYKSTTIQRRITRRMVLNKLNTLESYARFLRGNAKELDALYSDALISVTSFFRNPEAFDVLKRTVFPKLLERRGDQPFRAWVLGCSTGQEAYSIAMAFVEAADNAPRMPELQVFATDLNDALLDKARHGFYAKGLADDIAPERLRRFFVEQEGGYRVVKPLREMVVFARQNLISDPPFSRMDLISCRNLLIYLEPSLQKKALPTFHYALKPGGFLFLGASESIGGFTDLFEPADKKHKIYSKKPALTPALHLPARKEHGHHAPAGRPPPLPMGQGEAPQGFRAELNAQREADRIIGNRFAPPGVLIDADLQILQFRGLTGAYLEPPTGKASFDVLKMARAGLMLPLRGAINQAKKENKTVRKENVRIEQNGKTRAANLEVIPLKNLRERCFLILFEEAEEAGRAGPGGPSPEAVEPPGMSAEQDSNRIAELETDLSETREYLRSMQEQHEAANEELQAANEEAQSANEELQSMNEELETSKEELESANEELSTVNEEMSHRNVDLNRLNNDLVNFQTSAKLALVLLGRDLCIRRFSPEAEKLFDLVASDVGRPIGHMRHNLVLADGAGSPLDLAGLGAEVIASVREQAREVREKAGRWYSLRARPYLTLDHKVDGAVLVLVDIDAQKRAEQAIAAARDYAENTIETVREPLLVLDKELHVESANRSFYRTFRVAPAETIGKVIFELGNRQWDIPRLRELLEQIVPHNTSIEEFQVEHDFEGIGKRVMLLNARRIQDPQPERQRILLAIQDITERKEAEEKMRQAEERLRSVLDSVPQKIFTAKPNGDVDYFNPQWTEFTGLPFEEIEDWGWTQFIHPDDVAENVRVWRQSIDTSEPFQFEHRFRLANGEYRWHISRALPMWDAQDRIVMWIGSSTEIHEQQQTANKLQQLAADLSDADRRKNEFLALLAHELRNPLAPIQNALQVMRLTGEERGAVHSAFEMIERQVGQMVRLVDDLLDVSRISRGKIELRKGRVELASVVNHAVEAARPLAQSMGHELSVMLPPKPIYLHGDPTRLAQVVGNLLNNACKFTDQGGRIWLTVEREPPRLPPSQGTPPQPPLVKGGNGGVAVIRVRDTGLGIPPDELRRIFEAFVQIDTSLERSVSGLGIGLTLVKSVVEMHGGTVEANSAGVGQGSELVVRLPLPGDEWRVASGEKEEAGGDPLATHHSPLTTKRRILVVDDNPDSAESLATLLQLSGNETHIAHDGLQALEAAERFRPDVVLLDIGLPQLNGYDAARRIRAEPWGKTMMLIALTGWGQDEDRRRSKDAGFDAHLVKPVDYGALMELLTLPAEQGG